MKVLYLAVECKPFSQVGGVGDVAGELPVALKRANRNVDIEIVTPLYGRIDLPADARYVSKVRLQFHGKREMVEIFQTVSNGVPVNFVKNQTYFEGAYSEPYIYSDKIPFFDDALRFSFFSEACLGLIKDKHPDIVHVNDWGLGYLLARMVMENMRPRRVLTVHNIGYQGNIGKEVVKGWQLEKILNHKSVGRAFVDPRPAWNSVNALRLGLELADRANTVSQNYCREITLPENKRTYFEGGKGLHEVTRKLHRAGRLVGILNGYEYQFTPTDKKFKAILSEKAQLKQALGRAFTNPEAFLLGFVGRAVEQKFKLLTERVDGKPVLQHILDIPGVNVAIIATGLPKYERFLRKFANRPNCSATLAFDREKAKQISLGSDVFLMPSLFEPCGITQVESLSHATPPLVRWTGGLVDTVKPHTAPDGTGFGFDGKNRKQLLRNLLETVNLALQLWTSNSEGFRDMQRRAFKERFLWSTSAREYIEKIYLPLLAEKPVTTNRQ